MIIVSGYVRFGDGEIERLRSALNRNIVSSRGEDGCLSYRYSIDFNDPNLLMISEAWRDQAALDGHAARVAELMAPLDGADIREISIKAYRADYLTTLAGE